MIFGLYWLDLFMGGLEWAACQPEYSPKFPFADLESTQGPGFGMWLLRHDDFLHTSNSQPTQSQGDNDFSRHW